LNKKVSTVDPKFLEGILEIFHLGSEQHLHDSHEHLIIFVIEFGIVLCIYLFEFEDLFDPDDLGEVPFGLGHDDEGDVEDETDDNFGVTEFD
jgi:hypothetical protein